MDSLIILETVFDYLIQGAGEWLIVVQRGTSNFAGP